MDFQNEVVGTISSGINHGLNNTQVPARKKYNRIKHLHAFQMYFTVAGSYGGAIKIRTTKAQFKGIILFFSWKFFFILITAVLSQW